MHKKFKKWIKLCWTKRISWEKARMRKFTGILSKIRLLLLNVSRMRLMQSKKNKLLKAFKRLLLIVQELLNIMVWKDSKLSFFNYIYWINKFIALLVVYLKAILDMRYLFSSAHTICKGYQVWQQRKLLTC